MRKSGAPVDLEKLKKFDEEWKKGFDNFKAIHGEDMKALQEDLQKFEKELLEKYPVIEEWEFMTTKKAWLEKVKHYGPIFVARHADNLDELVYVINDTPM